MLKIFGLVVLSLSSAYASVLKHEFIELHSAQDVSAFKAQPRGEYDSAAISVYKNSENDIIKVKSSDLKGKSSADMMKNFNKNINQFALLFQDRVSPYTGGVTVNTECGDKNSTRHVVERTSDSVSTFFNTTATANLVYGKCDGDKSGFQSKYFLVLCKKKSVLYDVRYFSKKTIQDLDVKCVK